MRRIVVGKDIRLAVRIPNEALYGIASAAVLAVTIFMIFFYDKIVIRYGINLVIVLAAWMKRDFILAMYRKVRRKK